MMPGETIHSGASPVCDCGTPFEMEPLRSNAGWFVGTTCHNPKCEWCGHPNSRESGYYRTREEVVEAMRTDNVNWRT